VLQIRAAEAFTDDLPCFTVAAAFVAAGQIGRQGGRLSASYVDCMAKLPEMKSNKAILPLTSILLLATYLYLTFIFRPANTVSYPGIEERIWTIFIVFFTASLVFYFRELVAVLNTISSRCLSILPFEALKPHLKNLHSYMRDRTPPFAKHVSSKTGKILSPIYDFFLNMREYIRKNSLLAKKHLTLNFSRGKPNYFAILGLAVFLMLSPLVIYKQKELVEPAALLFIGFIILSYMKKLDDRIMIVSALLFLLSCPFLLIMKEDARAELAAIYAYYALCAGVFLQFVDYLQNREKYEKEEAEEGEAKAEEVEEGSFRITLPFGKK